MVNMLIADDNVPFCENLCNVLTKEKDFRVLCFAHSGEEAEKKYFETMPDVMILDLDIPIKDGLEVIKSITEKENSNSPPKNIIVVSGDTNYRASLTNVEKVKWVFPKPIQDYNELINVVRNTKNIQQVNSKVIEEIDSLLDYLKIPYSKGRKLLKDTIFIAYKRPMLLNKIKLLMRNVAIKNNQKNVSSVRSTVDKTISRTFDNCTDLSIFEIFENFYGEKLTTRDFLGGTVRYIKKKNIL